jgi:hypothetical protein
MGLFTPDKERGIQLYMRDDGDFVFRELDIEDAFLVEKDSQGGYVKAWMMFFKLLREFSGLKGVMHAGKVTVSYGRDIVYDPYEQLKPEEKPKPGDSLVKDFVKKIAESKCYQHEHSHKQTWAMDKITTFSGFTMILLGLAIGIQQAVH